MSKRPPDYAAHRRPDGSRLLLNGQWSAQLPSKFRLALLSLALFTLFNPQERVYLTLIDSRPSPEPAVCVGWAKGETIGDAARIAWLGLVFLFRGYMWTVDGRIQSSGGQA